MDDYTPQMLMKQRQNTYLQKEKRMLCRKGFYSILFIIFEIPCIKIIPGVCPDTNNSGDESSE